MIVQHSSKSELRKALTAVNKIYKRNVEYNRAPEPRGKNLMFTLKVKDSSKPGHRLGFSNSFTGKQRRMASACWHIHGDFFEALLKINPDAIIKTGAGNKNQIYSKNGEVFGNWEDSDIGSMAYPMFFSEACECE